MKEHPILFSPQMVRAILDGTKTQTRRPIPVMPKENQSIHHIEEIDKYCFVTKHENGKVSGISEYFRRPYNVGDRLWVRETWNGPLLDEDETEADPDWIYHSEKYENVAHCYYKADGVAAPEYVDLDDNLRQGWRPSIHMPRWASRLTLEVKAIRAEPLHDISDHDAMREGIYKSFDHGTQFPVATDWDGNEKVLVAGVPRRDFEELWRGLYPEGLKSWGMAPWVWVIDFEVVKNERNS